jgi:hypothetical protein
VSEQEYLQVSNGKVNFDQQQHLSMQVMQLWQLLCTEHGDDRREAVASACHSLA